MSEETQTSEPATPDDDAWAGIIQQWQDSIVGAVQRREDLIIGTESFLSLLMLSYRFARKTYEDAGAPYGKSAAAVLAWLDDQGAVLYDERDPWPRDADGPIVGITVINLGDYRDEVTDEQR